MNGNRGRWIALALFVLMLSGCKYQVIDANRFISGIALWFWGSLLIGAVALGVVGWKIREKTEAAGWVMMLIGVVTGLFIAPSAAVNGAAVDDAGFRMRGGLLGMTYFEAKYADTRSVKHTYEESTTRYGERYKKYFLECVRADGSKEWIHLTSVGAEQAARFFVAQAKAKGIAATDETLEADFPFWLKNLKDRQ